MTWHQIVSVIEIGVGVAAVMTLVYIIGTFIKWVREEL